MTTFITPTTAQPVRRRRRTRAGHLGVWVIRVVMAAQFIAGGLLKLSSHPTMVAMFEDIGTGQWLRLLVGACEVAGGVGLLVRPLTRLAAVGLVGLMVGATATNAVVLQTSPVVPLILLALAIVVAVAAPRTRSGR